MLFRHTSLAFLFCIVICAGPHNGRQAVEAAERPAALILYPDATGIQFDERGGADRLSYHVSSKFPAISIIQLISDKLGKGGWEALRYDFMNPNRPSSPLQGWQEFLDGTKKPALCVHQWLGEWKDASGNIVIYAFRYKQPKCSTLALTDLEVTAWYTPADVVRRTQQALEKLKKDHNLK